MASTPETSAKPAKGRTSAAPSTPSAPDAPAKTPSLAVERLARILLPKLGEPRDVRSLYLVEPETNVGRVQAHSRTSATIPAGDEVSFETYFNAFPASYWRRWTNLKQVVLRLELTGTARVDIYRSKIDGARIAVTGQVVGSLAAPPPAPPRRSTARMSTSARSRFRWPSSKTAAGSGST